METRHRPCDSSGRPRAKGEGREERGENGRQAGLLLSPFSPLPSVGQRHCLNPSGRPFRAPAIVLALLLIIGLAPTRIAEAAPSRDSDRNKRRFSLSGVEVAYHPGDAGLARQAGLAVRQACIAITTELGISFVRPVTVFLVRGRAEFLESCGGRMPPWALAAALPDRGAMVVDAALVTPATANDMRLVIAHETVHLALAQDEEGRPDRLPRWFHEGVATWLSGTRHVRENRSAFTLAAAQGALLSFDDLERGFPRDRSEADLAYLQSEAFVAHIVGTRSPEALRWILDRYRAGESFNEAFRGALGMSRKTMEARWARSFRKRFPWLKVVWELTTLFGVLAVVTIFIFFIIRWRARRQHRQWKEEEEMWTVVDGDEEEPEPDEDDLFA